MWVTDTPPTGWLLCDGSLVSRADFANLFAVIGTTYGAGDGVTTFGLPDLRGRFPLGQDDMGGSPANRVGDAAAAQLAGSGGEELRDTRGDTISGDTTLTASQSGSGAHTHDVNASDGLTPGSSHKVALHRNVTNTSVISNAAIAGGGSGSGATEGHNHTISSGDANQDFMNPYQVLNFIIAH